MGPVPVVAAIRRAVREQIDDLEPGALVLAACSGGADSLALAAALAVEAPRRRLLAGAITVDHGLTADSAQQAARVLTQVRELGLVVAESVRVTVAGPGGPEAAARRARYAALESGAVRLGAVAVLLGHTRDDQAETVLLGLARGAGLQRGVARSAGSRFRSAGAGNGDSDGLGHDEAELADLGQHPGGLLGGVCGQPVVDGDRPGQQPSARGLDREGRRQGEGVRAATAGRQDQRPGLQVVDLLPDGATYGGDDRNRAHPGSAGGGGRRRAVRE